jgi:hypothetical protein
MESEMKRVLMTFLAAAALAGALAACETATPYQALNPGARSAGGYSDTKLDASHWRVTFSGNTVTRRETVERYLLYRAAELTVNQGNDWFEEVQKDTDKKSDVWIDPFYAGWGYGYGWHPYWRFRRAGYYGGYYGGWASWGPGWGYDPWGPTYISTFDRYEASSQIVMGKGAKPDPRALDAHEVMMNLGPQIARPKA